MSLRTLRGSDGASLPALAFDTEAVQSVAVAAGAASTVSVEPGVYYILSRDADFSFTHGSGDLSGNTQIPWFQDVYLELVIVEPGVLSITMASGASGSVIIAPTQEHSK